MNQRTREIRDASREQTTQSREGSTMSSNLYAASLQWSTRPDDERWESLEEMLSACRAHRDSAREAVVPINTLRACVGGDGAELELVGKKGTPARLTHWAFGQLSQKAGAPAEYLRR